MASIMTERAYHGRKNIDIFNNRAKLSLAQNNVSHMHNVECMSEIVIWNTLHPAGNSAY